MLRYVCCLVLLLPTTNCFAQGSFHVFAADKKNQQVLSISVRVNGESLITTSVRPLRLPFSPTGITAFKNGRRLIVSSASTDETGQSSVADVQVLPGGKLRVAETASLGGPAGYTSLDRLENFFLFANYRTGTVGVHRLKGTGGVGEQVCLVKTPRTEAHCVLTTRDNRFVYVPCVKNNNALYQFAFDNQTGQLTPLEPFDASPPAMFGPRHVAYHPTLPVVYFSNEQQLGVSVYEIGKNGQLADRQHATSMARRSPYVKGKRGLHASDLVVSSNGKRLFLAVRDFVGDEDSVFTFKVEDDGKLSLLARTSVGDIPWKLSLSPDGQYLLVSEAFDRRLLVLKIHDNGVLSPAGHFEWGAEVRDMVVVQAR